MQNNKAHKIAVYHGRLVLVPDKVNFIATDENGKTYGYSEEPEQLFNMFANGEYEPMFGTIKLNDRVFLGATIYEGDWEDSLITI